MSQRSAALFTLAALAIVSAWPLAVIATQMAQGFPVEIFSPRQARLLGNSLLIATCVTLCAALLGTAVGLAIQYLRVSARRLLMLCFPISFLIPPYLLAIAWIDLAGKNGLFVQAVEGVTGIALSMPNPYSVAGAVWVLSLAHFPVVTAATIIAIARLDSRHEEAGLLVQNRRSVFFRVTLPLLTPAIATASLVVFFLTLVNFSVPSLLQVQVYPVEIHTQYAAFHDVSGGLWAAFPLMGLSVIGAVAWLIYIGRRKDWFAGHVDRNATARGSRLLRMAAATTAWSIIAIATLLPIATLVWRSMPPTSFTDAWNTSREELAFTITLGALSATGIVALGFAMTQFVQRMRSARIFTPLTLLPFLLSGPALGLGLILVWNHPGWRGAVYDSQTILVLALLAKFLFFGFAGIALGKREVSSSLLEAASLMAGPRWRQLAAVEVPLMAPVLLGVWALMFILSTAEIDTTLMVAPPGSTTLPIRIYGLMHYGPSNVVAALGLIVIAVALSAGLLFTACYHFARKAIHADDSV